MKRIPPSKEMYILAKARSNKILNKINVTGETLPEIKVIGPTLEKIKVVTKIKVSMNDWYMDAKNLPDWFVHGKDAEITWEQLQELHNAGLSIMLRQPGKTGICLLGVSNTGFSQR